MNCIKPFCDIYYKDCYYNSLFTILRVFKKNNILYYLKEVDEYIFENNNFKLINKEIIPEKKILEDYGIFKKKKHIFKTNIFKFITSKNLKKQMIILSTDCFFLPHRKDCYKKKHVIHETLICGIDNNYIYILDHSNEESLDYSIKAVLKKDFLISIFSHKIEKKNRYFHIFSLINNKNNINYSNYIDKYLSEKIKYSQKNGFQNFIETELKKLEKIKNKNKINRPINKMNKIINFNQIEIELYKAIKNEKILKDNSIFEKILKIKIEIVEILNFFRKIFIKVLYAISIEKDKLKFQEKFDLINKLECEYYNIVLKYKD